MAPRPQRHSIFLKERLDLFCSLMSGPVQLVSRLPISYRERHVPALARNLSAVQIYDFGYSLIFLEISTDFRFPLDPVNRNAPRLKRQLAFVPEHQFLAVIPAAGFKRTRDGEQELAERPNGVGARNQNAVMAVLTAAN